MQMPFLSKIILPEILLQILSTLLDMCMRAFHWSKGIVLVVNVIVYIPISIVIVHVIQRCTECCSLVQRSVVENL